jgi:hypothetical protein
MNTKFFLLRILFGAILFSVFQNVDCQNKNNDTNNVSNNFKYNIVIDMNHLSNNDDFNYKYIINRGYILDENDSLIILAKGKMYYMKYLYLLPEKDNAIDYLREPIDTIVIGLADSELEMIYKLARNVFSIEGEIDYRGEKLPTNNYDGKYANLSFELEEYSTKFNVTLDFSIDDVFQNKFNKLLDYLQTIRSNNCQQ